MKSCPKCGAELQNENFKVCPECGCSIGAEKSNSSVTESYAPDKNMRRIFLFEFISRTVVLIVSFIASLVPVMKIGTTSLGNSWEILIGSLGDIFDLDYLFTNSILVLPSALIVGMVLAMAFGTLLSVVARKSERYYYSRYRSSLIGSIIRGVIKIVIGTICVIALCGFYKIFSQSGVLISVLVLVYIIRDIAEYIFACRLTRSNHAKLSKYQKVRTAEPKHNACVVFYSIGELVTISAMIVMCVFSCFYYSALSNSVWIEEHEDALIINAENRDEISNFYNTDECKSIINSAHPNKKLSYSYNYIFYNNFIEKCEEEIELLMHNDGGESDLAEHLEKCDELRSDIEEAKRLRDENYKYVETLTYESANYRFNIKSSIDSYASSNSSKEKWGVDVPWYVFGGEESITLSQTEFSQSTDFNKRIILAYVTYADGSVRFSVIKPDNANDLNEALPGSHTLVWTDDWGTYEVEIKIR